MVTQAAGAVLIALAIALLVARRHASAARLAAGLAACLAVAAALQGIARDAPLEGLGAAALLGGRSALLLWLGPAPRLVSTQEPAAPSLRLARLAAGLALTAAMLLATRGVALPAGTLTPDDLAATLALVLVGSLVVVTRPALPFAAAGALTVEAGAALAAIAAGPDWALAQGLTSSLALAALAIPQLRPGRPGEA